MKYLFLYVFSIVLFFGCQPKPAKITQKAVDLDGSIDSQHNSKNSLDWAGAYKGILDCSDCEGVLTSINLNADMTYTLTQLSDGKNEKTVLKQGKFDWSADGGKVTLFIDGKLAKSHHYLVSENVLIKLDKEGNRLTGEAANKSRLEKLVTGPKLQDNTWRLLFVNDHAIIQNPGNEKYAFIKFNLAENKMNGNGGCNSYGGSFLMEEGNKFSLTDIYITEMACPSILYESKYMKALNQVNYYSIVNDTLILHDMNRTVELKYALENKLK